MKSVQVTPGLPLDFLESLGATRGDFGAGLSKKLRLAGGGGVFPLKLCQALSRRMDVDLVAPAPFNGSYDLGNGFRVFLTKAYYGTPFSPSNPYALPPPEVFKGSNLVHVHQIHKTLSNTTLVRNPGLPVFVTHHAGGGLSLELSHAYQAHLAVSRFSSTLYKGHFSGNGVIFGGADPAEGEAIGTSWDMVGNHEGPVLLFVGVFRRNKRVKDLIGSTIALFDMGYNPLLVLCGEAWTTWEMESLISSVPRRCRGHVLFTSYVSEEKKNDLYRNCDVFVSASVDEYLGLVFIEAMMHSKPVIARRIGGVPEIVLHGKTGLLVDDDNIKHRNGLSDGMDDLTRSIKALLDDPGLGKRMGRTGLRRAHKQFTWEVVAERTIRAYNQYV